MPKPPSNPLPNNPNYIPAPPPPSLGGGDLGVHLVVCILVAGTLGSGLDIWLKCAPIGLLSGVGLGFAAWLWQVWKSLKR